MDGEKAILRNEKKNHLIINSDDFGYCEERSQGIIELLEKEMLSSTTVMVNSPHIRSHLNVLK